MAERPPDLPPDLLALADDPDAVCITIDRSGSSTAPVPACLRDHFSIVETGGSPLEALAATSHGMAVSLFEVARRRGRSSGLVHLAHGELPFRMDIFDLQAEHDCLAVVLTPAGRGSLGGLALTATPTPRRCQLTLDASGVIVAADDAAPLMLGWTNDELIGSPALDLIDADDHARSLAFWAELLGEPGGARRVRQRWQRPDGSTTWVETTETNLLHDPATRHVVAELVDISDEMAAQLALRAREELLVRLTEALPSGVIQVDERGETVFSNTRWFQITELGRSSTLADFVALCEEVDASRISSALARTRDTGIDSELVVAIETPEANHRIVRVRLCGLGDAETESSVLACLEDVTESHLLQRRLREQAQRDPLTGLLNRAALMASLAGSVYEARRTGHTVGVLFVDLDDFKSVNDRFGHAAGDDLLRRVADTIAGCIRSEDVAGRLGGDEFVVVIPELQSDTAATTLANRLEIELSSLIVAPGERLLSGSIGVGILDPSMSSADELLAAADEAMYAVKHRKARDSDPAADRSG